MSPEENLTNAIILQAAADYRDALKKLSGGRRDKNAEYTKQDCERFFRSQWYEAMTAVDGEMLIKRLKEEVSKL